MQSFPTSDDNWEFSFGEEYTKPTLPEGVSRVTGYLEGVGKWENYTDKYLYEDECLLRQLFAQKESDPLWLRKSGKYRRFTCKMMFEVLYGREYDPKTADEADRLRFNRLPRLMKYYSSRMQKEAYILGKRHKSTVYSLSMKRARELAPFSLRLRLEWLEEQGRTPCWQNMKLVRDDLSVGHARNPRTDANMERRREEGKRIYNERYKDRAH